jgi:hypothetical protein
VTSGMFIFLDADAPSPQSMDFSNDIVVVRLPTKAGIQVMTAANDFYPVVEFHIHDEGPPPPSPGGWEDVFETYLEVQSGLVQLMNEMWRIAVRFPLDPGRWNLRCHVRGREAAKQRWMSWDPNEPEFHDLEEWLFQLWMDDRTEGLPRSYADAASLAR